MAVGIADSKSLGGGREGGREGERGEEQINAFLKIHILPRPKLPKLSPCSTTEIATDWIRNPIPDATQKNYH